MMKARAKRLCGHGFSLWRPSTAWPRRSKGLDEQVHLASNNPLLLAAAVDKYFGLARCTALVENDDGAGAPSARRAASAMQELKGVIVSSVHRPLGISASIR